MKITKDQLKELSDENLVSLVVKNKNLFEEIINRYQKKIWNYIFHLVGKKDDTDDLTQEVFIKTFINLQGFSPKFKFTSWIFRIAHNETINYLKKKKKIISLDEKFLKTAKTNNLEDEIDKKEILKNLNLCLEKLPVEYREVINLYYFNNLGYQEISDVLKVSPGTVASRLFRAKSLLIKLCQKEKILKK